MLHSKTYSYRPSGNGYTTFTPNGRALTALAAVYTIGVATLIAAAVAALTGAIYVCSLLVSTICQLVSTITLAYSHADSFTQLLFIGLVLFIASRIFIHFPRSHRPATR